jgi:SAM-dependent methyltransferase
MPLPEKDPTQRFSRRVQDYVRYRPHYPEAVLGVLREEIGFTPAAVIADVGSGTGISTELLLRNGNRVFAIEPNREMREAAEAQFGGGPGFVSIDGTAEATTLPDAAVDLVLAAQAFHWFRPEPTRAEFRRILKPGGWVVLLWNRRLADSDPFARAYEELLQRFSSDYQEVRHERVDAEAIRRFLGGPSGHRSLPNSQRFDREALRGRLLSSSYAPLAGAPGHEAMMTSIDQIFREHQRDGRVEFCYEVQIYFGHLGGN